MLQVSTDMAMLWSSCCKQVLTFTDKHMYDYTCMSMFCMFWQLQQASLHKASEHGHGSVVERLLQTGADEHMAEQV